MVILVPILEGIVQENRRAAAWMQHDGLPGLLINRLWKSRLSTGNRIVQVEQEGEVRDESPFSTPQSWRSVCSWSVVRSCSSSAFALGSFKTSAAR